MISNTVAGSTVGPKILIADREPSVARHLGSLLTRLGFVVAGVADSLAGAIRLAEETEPDIALVDAALEDPAGRSAAGWRTPLGDRVPVLYTVADEGPELRRVRAAHPGGYLLKPFAEAELRTGIATALDERDSRSATHRFDEEFFDISIDMLCCLGFDGYFARLNPAWERVLGFSREELMARPFIEFVHPDDRERTLRQNREVRSGGFANSFENRYLCKDGSYRWLLWNAAPDLARSTIYSVARDITERKRAEEALERLSTTDELTDLWNRRGFSRLAERELRRAARESLHVLLLYMDLDRFKEVNDTHGHTEGDGVLVDVARLLQESCRGSDIVARIGGDEFVLLALGEEEGGERIISERIQHGLRRLNEAGRHPYEVGLTIGAACLAPGERVDLRALLARADEQMYGKKRGKRDQGQGAP